MNLNKASDAQFLKDEINKDEKLLWSGHPDPKRAMTASLGIFVFAIPWTLFSIFWVGLTGMGIWSHLATAGIFNVFPLFGLPFVLIGFGMLSLPWFAAAKAKNTHYGITDKRIIILVAGKTKTAQHYELSKLANPSRTEYGARGDISWSVTGQVLNYSQGNVNNAQYGASGNSNVLTFVGIDKPRDVERLVEDAQAKLALDVKNVGGGGLG